MGTEEELDAAHEQLRGASDPGKVRQGVYSNVAVIRNTPLEFIADFLLMLSNDEKILVARVIMSPDHAKRLLKALETNIKKYEAGLQQSKE